MGNRLLCLIKEAQEKRWCVQPYCTTCGCRDFRHALLKITDLTKELTEIDIDKMVLIPIWCDAVRVAAIDNWLILDWNLIFKKWYEHAEKNVRFADYVYFYLVSRFPCSNEIKHKWTLLCFNLAKLYKDYSLFESLIRVLGKKADTYNGLVDLAIIYADYYPLLRDSLVKAGYLPSNQDIQRKAKREANRKIAAKNLFGAIRRNDINAIQALLRKKPDLEITNNAGQTPLEFAQSMNNSIAVTMINAFLENSELNDSL
jgi:hypothetical protein